MSAEKLQDVYRTYSAIAPLEKAKMVAPVLSLYIGDLRNYFKAAVQCWVTVVRDRRYLFASVELGGFFAHTVGTKGPIVDVVTAK